jgi:predicted MFS family arabinose efflux permease
MVAGNLLAGRLMDWAPHHAMVLAVALALAGLAIFLVALALEHRGARSADGAVTPR